MREIKFRAWDKMHKRFFYASVHPTHIGWSSPDYADQSLLRRNENVEGVGFLNIEGWQQYTGVLDKNGKEIYEGDIVKNIRLSSEVCGEIAVVEYAVHFQNCGFEATPKPWHELKEDILGFEPEWIEVIGNIYENPEMLT